MWAENWTDQQPENYFNFLEINFEYVLEKTCKFLSI